MVVLGWLWLPINLAPAYGRPPTETLQHIAETVAVEDVVEAHVKALDTEKVPGSFLEYLMCSDGPHGPTFADAVDIVKRRLPELASNGEVPMQHGVLGEEPPFSAATTASNANGALLGTIPHYFDAHAVEREVLGHPLKDFEAIIVETASWMATLPSETAAG